MHSGESAPTLSLDLVRRFASGCGRGTISSCGSIQPAFRNSDLLVDGCKGPSTAKVSSSFGICAHHAPLAIAQQRVLAVVRLHRLCSRHAVHKLVSDRLSIEKHLNVCDAVHSCHPVLRHNACMLAMNLTQRRPPQISEEVPVSATAAHTLRQAHALFT